jgi:S-DNA-T family DNA segregation ATPase FtsK/SpoIIIE
MTNKSLNSPEPERKHIFAWLLFPLSLFPMVALLTYDWRAIDTLNSPPIPSTNWIGSLGDFFAYYGYCLFGLAIWILPFMCIVTALATILGRRMRPGRREIWFTLFLISVSCLCQAIGVNGGIFAAASEKINISNPGGAIGYLLMTRLLTPMLNPFGSCVIVIIIMLIALVAAVGARNIAAFFNLLARWATAGINIPKPKESDEEPEPQIDNKGFIDKATAYNNALKAKEDARRQREAEIAAAKAAKAKMKADKIAAKAAAKAAARNEVENVDNTNEENTDALIPSEGKGPYVIPPVSLLDPIQEATADHGDVNEISSRLISTLKLFGIDATLEYTVQGPVVTQYAITLSPGTNYNRVTSIETNLMGALHAKSIRIQAPIPGENCVGIEVPNRKPVGISFREIYESDEWQNFKGALPLLFGKDATGKDLVADLATMPHMLVAGATGQGKSVCLNSIINGFLMTKTPEQLRLIMIDPKSVEFTPYAALPHLLTPVITDNNKASSVLRMAVTEMSKRLKLFSSVGVRNISDFNKRPQLTQTNMFGDDTQVGSGTPRRLPYIVIIIDEVADLMQAAGKEVLPCIQRLAAVARAAGIHLILATQRPDAKIINGTVKSNIPGRVAFKTSSSIDSRTILDASGAENLIGKGDMLYRTPNNQIIRAQGAWISDDEIGRITSFISQHSQVQFDETFTRKLSKIKEASFDDDDEDESEGGKIDSGAKEKVKAKSDDDEIKMALECIINTHRASTSHFQRRLKWGYNHAANIIDKLEEAGVVGPQVGAGPRQIIMDDQQLIELFNSYGNSNTEADGDGDGDNESEIFADDLFMEDDNQ